jgi:SAM-dependent methyltransferase
LKLDEYIASTYGDKLADVYDDWFSTCDPLMIDVLADLARGGRALELGIGTGRIAIPLASRGVEVSGIDASKAMIGKLKARPGGESIVVTSGNFADVRVDGTFSLVYIVFNTFYALLTQPEQTRCFRNVAAHLAPGGSFVIEAFVPDVTRFQGNQAVRVHELNMTQVRLQVSQHDPVEQRVNSQNLLLADGTVKLYPVEIRYVWPSEMDLMAELAGLSLAHRWSDWDGGRLTATSEKHVSVFKKPES